MKTTSITLEPSQAVVSEIAGRIYAAYITAGGVNDIGVEGRIKRSIGEAIAIAKTVRATVKGNDDLSASSPATTQEEGQSPTREHSRGAKQKTREKRNKAEVTSSDSGAARGHDTSQSIETLADEVLQEELSEEGKGNAVPPAQEAEPGKQTKASLDRKGKDLSEPEPEDSSDAARKALEQVARGTPGFAGMQG